MLRVSRLHHFVTVAWLAASSCVAPAGSTGPSVTPLEGPHPRPQNSAKAPTTRGDDSDTRKVVPREWVCPEWTELSEPFRLNFALEPDANLRERFGEGAISLRLPGGLKPADHIMNGTQGPECEGQTQGCRIGHQSLLDEVTAFAPICGQPSGDEVAKIIAIRLAYGSDKLDLSPGESSVTADSETCWYATHIPQDFLEIQPQHVVEHRLEYANDIDGLCTVQWAGIRPSDQKTAEPRRYYVYTLLHRDPSGGRLNFVNIAFVTPEAEWGLLQETFKRIAGSLQVDWNRLIERQKQQERYG